MSNNAFGESLQLLLSALDISNSRLSKAINVDSSLVNRWIHGKRVPPYNSGYIESISQYLSNNVHNTYQEQQISKIFSKICIEEEITDNIKEKIKKILLESQGSSMEFAKRKRKENKINALSKGQIDKVPGNEEPEPLEQNASSFIDLSGEDKVVLGARNIVAAYHDLLELAVNHNGRSSDTIYISYNNIIFIDQISDHDFQKWSSALLKIINNGWKVILLSRWNTNTVRTVRVINSMISLVQTGKFMPYYIKNYDSMTIGDALVVVPESGVLSGFSTDFNPYINCGLYIKSKQAINIYQSHIQSIISKYALPLVNVFTNRTEYSHYMADSEDDIGNRFLYKYCFSVLTLPEHLYWKLLGSRKSYNNSKITSMEFYRKRLRAFLSNIQNYQYKDVYTVSSIKDLMKNQQFYLYSYEGIEAIHMDNEDTIEFLENIIELLQKYDNYEMAFLPSEYDIAEHMESFCCLVKERSTVLFESNNQFINSQEIHTYITEPTLVKTVYDYFIEVWEHIPPAYKEKAEVILWLQYQVKILRRLI